MMDMVLASRSKTGVRVHRSDVSREAASSAFRHLYLALCWDGKSEWEIDAAADVFRCWVRSMYMPDSRCAHDMAG